MRDLIIVGFILGAVPFCFFQPYIGVLFWTWISYFNPHRYAWGFAYYFPVATVIAVPTLTGMIFTKSQNRQKNLLTRETVLLAMLWIWFCATTFYASNVALFAGHMDDAKSQINTVSKILLMTFLTMLLIVKKEQFQKLVIVVALSCCVRALFGATFGFQTDGSFRVYGPPETFIADNNDFALALNMVLAIMFFLAKAETRKWYRIGYWATFFSSIICILLSYSRGGLLGLGTVILLIAIKSKKKVLAGAILAVGALLVITFSTDQWKERMGGAAEGHIDDSARQRLVSWGFALNLVKDYPFTGGGFETFGDDVVFQKSQKEPLPGGFLSSGPHSIYFQMLGEQGFVGLGIFFSLILSMLFTLRRIRKRAQRLEAAAWALPYANMLEIGLAAYLVSGAFLGRAYFDLFYELVALTVILKLLSRKDVYVAQPNAEETVEEPAELEEAVPA